jgi:hypothetical protein
MPNLASIKKKRKEVTKEIKNNQVSIEQNINQSPDLVKK